MEEASINYIWKYRKRARLVQKQVAYLLGDTDATQFSKWENGKKLPSLENALKLSCILKTPVEVLFENLYRSVDEEIERKEKTIPRGVQRSNNEVLISESNPQK